MGMREPCYGHGWMQGCKPEASRHRRVLSLGTAVAVYEALSLHYSLFRSSVQSGAVYNDLYNSLYTQWVAFLLLLKFDANFHSSLPHEKVFFFYFNMCVLIEM